MAFQLLLVVLASVSLSELTQPQSLYIDFVCAFISHYYDAVGALSIGMM